MRAVAERAVFESFAHSEQWFQLSSSERVPFDREVAGSRLLNPCPKCDQYELAGGSHQARQLVDALPADLCETDLALPRATRNFAFRCSRYALATKGIELERLKQIFQQLAK